MNYEEFRGKISSKLNKKVGIFVLLAVVIIVVAATNIRKNELPKTLSQSSAIAQEANPGAGIIYYSGQECGRCKKVEKFIDDNKIVDKIAVAQKEVWHSPSNNSDMKERAMECLLDPSKVGVPFLWARGKCYEGEVEVEKFLKKEAGIQ